MENFSATAGISNKLNKSSAVNRLFGKFKIAKKPCTMGSILRAFWSEIVNGK